MRTRQGGYFCRMAGVQVITSQANATFFLSHTMSMPHWGRIVVGGEPIIINL